MEPSVSLIRSLAPGVKSPIKTQAKHILWDVKRTLFPAGVWALPDFLIIGAQKAGTSSLYRNLSDHPDIVRAHRKEIKFFSDDQNYIHGDRWYRANFPSKLNLAIREKITGRHIITGEATPRYIFVPGSAGRVKHMMPEVKLIVLLRNPVDRAYSHYQMVVRKGVEKFDFQSAIDNAIAEVERLYSNAFAQPVLRNDYLSRGLYADQLKEWFAVFPRAQFLVLQSEVFLSDPVQCIGQVCEFLGVENYRPDIPQKKNVGSYLGMGDTMRAKLNDFYRPHNEQLYALLGQDFGWC